MLILLDIDGVMVRANSWKKPEFLLDGFPACNNQACTALQKLIDQTNADILLTTSHKANYSLEAWKNIFSLRGIKVNNIYSLPENKTFLSRKEEIINWVNASDKLPNFIIIDDDKSLNGLPTFVKKQLIQTNASVGLTADLIDEALQNLINNEIIVSK